MTQARREAAVPVTRHQGARVTAVLVTYGVSEYLPETLAALAGQTTAAQRVLLVDVAPDTPGRELEALVEQIWPHARDTVTVLGAPGARTFGDGVRAALAHARLVDDARPLARTGPGASASPAASSDTTTRGWLWLLHDDSAPAPTALVELLRAVDGAPSVALAGAKQRSWSQPSRVLEVGLATSRFGRRMTGIDEPEVDQGQYDGREDVLGVGIAGALVRADVWDALGGTDPALGPYGDGLDLSRRARLAGHRVIVVPRAVVRHAQASLARPTGGAVLNRPGWDVRRSVQARREAYLYLQLVGVPGVLVPVVAVLALLSSVVRALGRLVVKEPHLVVAEVLAPWAVLARPGRVARARRTARESRRLSRRSLRPLQVTWRDVFGEAQDRRLTSVERRRTRRAPSELELAELRAIRARRRGSLAAVLTVAVIVSALVVGPLVTRVLAGSRLTGGSLPLGDATFASVLSAATSGWVGTGLGSPGPADPLLAVLLPLTAVVGTVGRASAVVLLGALLAGALGAWFAAGAATRSTVLRAWAVLVWVGAPALLIALGEARLGAVLAHVALPWVVLGVARAVGVARVDVVESGLVGARRRPLSDAAEAPAADADAAPALDEPRWEATTAEPSLAAAAGAGLAFAVVVAGAPVLLPFGLLALVAVALAGPRRRRLAWVAMPALALQGPVLVNAVQSWGAGGWRVLVADPGLPQASVGAASWRQLLGWPVDPPAWLDVPASVALVAPLVATGAVTLVALVALLVAGPAGRAVRVGWVVAACGLAAAAVSARVEVGIAQTVSGSVLTTGWSGSGVSLALAGLLTASLVAAGGLRTAMVGHTFGWRQVGVAALAVLAVVGPGLTLGVWGWHVHSSQDLAMTATDVPVVPAAGQQLQRSPDDVRVLGLQVDDAGEVSATVLPDDGVQLTAVSRAVTARAVQGPPGQARAARLDAADLELADLAGRLATGASDEVATGLAALGIGAVLVPDDPTPGHAALVGRIDSAPGLERVTQTESGVIWRVAVGDLGTTTAWARLLDGSGTTEGALLAPVPAQDGTVDTDLPAGEGPRLLVLAERADAGWHASVDGVPLRAVETEWRQAFELGPEAGHLTVTYSSAGRVPWLVLQSLVVLATVLLALPVRRRRGAPR